MPGWPNALVTLVLLGQLRGIVAAPNPLSTPTPTKLQPQKRDISSWASSVAQGLPTNVASGILPAYQGLPNADQIKQQLNLTDDGVSRLPQSVLNIPSYANWTGHGWNIRIHGLGYKQPPATNEQLDQISSVFISDLDVNSLNDTEKQQSRNMSALMIAIPTSNVALNFSLANPTTNNTLLIEFPTKTDDIGEFDRFIQLNETQVPNNNTVAAWPLFTDGINDGNSTLWLVPPTGITILSDIDDILRFTQIYSPQKGLDNSFAYPFVPWSDMPSVYAKWNQVNPNVHFHYITTTPEPFTRQYLDFTYKYYPPGSFDDRPLNLTTVDQIFQIRKVNLLKFYETFPNRKIVLVADTSNGDVMRDYPDLLASYPNQTACVLIRNTSATDTLDKFPYNTGGFKDLPTNKYMFFRTPDDIRNLNFGNGDCVNTSVPQNVTFGYQGTPFSGSATRAGHFRLLHLEEITYAMGCTHLPHLMSQAVMPPEKQFIVEECGQCFHGIDGDMEVCTACFVASCREHAYLHYNKTSHQFSIAIRLVDPTQDERGSSGSEQLDEGDSEGTIGSTGEEEEEIEEVQCALRCWQCGREEEGEVIGLPDDHDAAETIDALMDAIRENMSMSHTDASVATRTRPELHLALPSVLIGLLEMTKFRNRYLPLATLHCLTCPAPDPRNCFNCQMHKLAVAIHDTPGLSSTARIGTSGVASMLTPPSNVGDLTGVSTMFMETLDLCRNVSTAQGGKDSVFERMDIQVEFRVECNQCKGVAYKTERLDTITGTAGNVQGVDVAAATFWSIDSWASAQEQKFNCPACKGETSLIRRRFQRFPQILLVEQVDGFVAASVDWDDIKGLDLERLRGMGLQDDETVLPEPRPVTPVRPRPDFAFLSPSKGSKHGTGRVGRRDIFPPSPSKGLSPSKRRRAAEAEALDLLRQATPSPTKRKRKMESLVPSPVKRAKELVNEEMASQDASEQEIAAVCALGFERELAMQALEETDGDVKKAVAMLLAWESAENDESEDEDEEGDEDEDEDEEDEDEDEKEEEEEEETDEGSTTSSLAALQERYGIGTEDEEQMAKEFTPVEIESGRYMLKAIIGHDSNGLWAVLKRSGMWVGRVGVVEKAEIGTRLEGVRLEFWERL